MKITIDTKEDSHEEIQKAIRLLSALIGDKEIISNQGDIFGDAPSDSGSSDDSGSGGIFNIFNSSSGSSESSEDKTDESEDKKEDDDIDIDIPEVEEYR